MRDCYIVYLILFLVTSYSFCVFHVLSFIHNIYLLLLVIDVEIAAGNNSSSGNPLSIAMFTLSKRRSSTVLLP